MIAFKIVRHAGISLAFLLSAASAAAAPPIAGEWLTEGGKASVMIGACGRAMCGRITKVHKPGPGFPTRDAANPDVTKRANPIEGTNILTDLTDGGAVWRGRIYNPTNGKTYDARLTPNADGSLKVEGCLAFLCRGPTWRRAR